MHSAPLPWQPIKHAGVAGIDVVFNRGGHRPKLNQPSSISWKEEEELPEEQSETTKEETMDDDEGGDDGRRRRRGGGGGGPR